MMLFLFGAVACGGPPGAVDGNAGSGGPSGNSRGPYVDPDAGVEAGDDWFEVDPVGLQELEEAVVHHQAHRRPHLAEGLIVEWPSLEEESWSGTQRHLIVQAVITRTGRVARARILRSDPPHLIASFELRERLADVLRNALLEPAEAFGKPIAVYYNLAIELRCDEVGS